MVGFRRTCGELDDGRGTLEETTGTINERTKVRSDESERQRIRRLELRGGQPAELKPPVPALHLRLAAEHLVIRNDCLGRPQDAERGVVVIGDRLIIARVREHDAVRLPHRPILDVPADDEVTTKLGRHRPFVNVARLHECGVLERERHYSDRIDDPGKHSNSPGQVAQERARATAGQNPGMSTNLGRRDRFN